MSLPEERSPAKKAVPSITIKKMEIKRPKPFAISLKKSTISLFFISASQSYHSMSFTETGFVLISDELTLPFFM